MRRKSIILTAVLVLLQLCSSLWALPTTAYEAETVVAGWLKTDPQPLSMALGQEVMRVETFIDNYGEPVYYIVYLEPSGFVIVSADDLVEPIIGFADDGTYDPSPENPLGALVSNDLNGRMAAVHNTFRLQAIFGEAPLSDTQRKWSYFISLAEIPEDSFVLMDLRRISDVRVAPLVQTDWGQTEECARDCYNYYTPNNYPAGCGATVMAQLMRYYQYPIEPNDDDLSQPDGRREFTITVDGENKTAYLRGGDGNGGPYEWEQMEPDPSCSATLEQRQAIGALCYDAGVAAKTEYFYLGSGTYLPDITNALLETFKFSNAINTRDCLSNIRKELLDDMVNTNLDAGYPVFLGISKEGFNVGHAILADGYGYDSSTPYHHLNMGWGGKYDAWYNLPTVDSGPPSIIIGSDPSYNVVNGCIYNIFTSGSGEIISGRVTDAYGSPISGATVTATGQGHNNTYTDETDSKGIYALAKINSQLTYTLSVTKSGYSFPSQDVRTAKSENGDPFSGNRCGVDFEAAFSFDKSSCAVEDFEAGDFSKFPWEQPDDYFWSVTRQKKHSGTYSAEGHVDWGLASSGGGKATLQVTLDCISGNINFHCIVNTGSGDYLIFYIDGEEKGRWPSELDWAEVSFPVTEGKRTFQWTYSKVSRRSDDGVWIDDIIFPIDYSSCPEPTSTWPNRDIGNPVPAGSANYDSNTETWTVQGSGHGIGGEADSFHYVYKPLLGDGEIITRVVSVENTDQSAMAGVMIRETLNSGSKHANLTITPGDVCEFKLRRDTGSYSESDTTNLKHIRPPHWLRLTRSGNQFRAYHSYDGKNWYELAWSPQTVVMSRDVYIGLVVSSHADGVLCTAVFYNGKKKAYEPASDLRCALEDFETNDFGKFPWEHEGGNYWYTKQIETHTGTFTYTAESYIEYFPGQEFPQNATLRVTLDCISGNISFYRRVNTFSEDYLIFYIDGVEKDKWNDTEDWAKVSFPVIPGQRTFQWTFSKLSNRNYQGGVWIDDIIFPVDCGNWPPPP